MRPDRSVVKDAITQAEGNLSRASSILGCSRQTLYTWIYQLGLARTAGVRIDNKSEVDRSERKDREPHKEMKSGVYSATADHASIRLVEPQTATQDYPIQATMRIPEALWKAVKIEAIREGCTVSEYVRRMLEERLALKRQAKEKPK